MHDITRVLNELDEGKSSAEELLPLVYDELRKLASDRLAQEQAGQTLAATGLVHEAWLRVAENDRGWDSRGHFFAAAAQAMRRILIDRARRKRSERRGGDGQRVDLDLDAMSTEDPDERLLKRDLALARLQEVEPDKAKLVELRYFAGCKIKEAAEIMGISTATADRHWAFARAWLQTEMDPDGDL